MSERFDDAEAALSYDPEPLDYQPETYQDVYDRLSDHVENELLTIDEANQIMEEYRRMYGW